MSLEDSDDLNISDATPVDPALEAGSLPKFDMHMYRSSLNESHVRYLVKLYGIPEKLHPRVVPEGMTMNTLPPNRAEKDCKPCLKDDPTSLKKWKDKFFLIDRRAAPIAMAWRHHDSSVADPFPKPGEYNASDVAKLREVVISLRRPPLSILYVWKHAGRAFSIKDSEGKVITMAGFLRLPNFKGCKVAAGTLLPPGTARVTHLAPPAARLEDIPPKTGDMIVVEIPCRKVVDDKEKKSGMPRGEGHHQGSCWLNSSVEAQGCVAKATENRAKPLEALANEEHVSIPLLVGRMDTLRDQTDETCVSPGSWPINKGGLSESADLPSPVNPSGMIVPAISWKCMLPKNVVPDVEASYSAGRFGNLPFTPQWGLTDSSHMDNSRECRDMVANFTPADEEFFNEGFWDESAIRRSWKLLCQSAQQQANVLLRFKALKEQHANLVYAHESCTDVKAHFKECRKELAAVQSAYDEKVSAYDQLSKNYDRALTREKGLQDRLEELEEEKKEADN
ncbi:PXMP2/4 family protein 4-like protein [Tanacetum coccineum]